MDFVVPPVTVLFYFSTFYFIYNREDLRKNKILAFQRR